MIYFHETIIQWDMVPEVDMLPYCCTMHNDTLCIIVSWSRGGVVLLASSHFLRLLSSPVQAQLMPFVRYWGSGPPYPKSGVLTPRVRAHPFPRARNNNILHCKDLSNYVCTLWYLVQLHWLRYYCKLFSVCSLAQFLQFPVALPDLPALSLPRAKWLLSSCPVCFIFTTT